VYVEVLRFVEACFCHRIKKTLKIIVTFLTKNLRISEI